MAPLASSSNATEIENGVMKREDRRRDVVYVVRVVARATEMCTSMCHDLLQSVVELNVGWPCQR